MVAQEQSQPEDRQALIREALEAKAAREKRERLAEQNRADAAQRVQDEKRLFWENVLSPALNLFQRDLRAAAPNRWIDLKFPDYEGGRLQVFAPTGRRSSAPELTLTFTVGPTRNMPGTLHLITEYARGSQVSGLTGELTKFDKDTVATELVKVWKQAIS